MLILKSKQKYDNLCFNVRKQRLNSYNLKYYQKIKEADVFKHKEKSLDMFINLKYGHVQSSKRYENLSEHGVYYSIIIDKLS